MILLAVAASAASGNPVHQMWVVLAIFTTIMVIGCTVAYIRN